MGKVAYSSIDIGVLNIFGLDRGLGLGSFGSEEYKLESCEKVDNGKFVLFLV